MIFFLENIDYRRHIIPGTYQVNQIPITRDWVDGYHRTRKSFIRNKVIGTFDMFFNKLDNREGGGIGLDPDCYYHFLETVGLTRGDGTSLIQCTVNNLVASRTFRGYISFEPKRNINGKWDDSIDIFTVTIEEQ